MISVWSDKEKDLPNGGSFVRFERSEKRVLSLLDNRVTSSIWVKQASDLQPQGFRRKKLALFIIVF